MIEHARRWPVTLALIVAAMTALAQDMTVESFRELTNDLTANVHGTMKYDHNGQLSALIKVVAPAQGFVFDGGAVGIVDVEAKAGETWLYVPRRIQRLTVSHTTFGMLRDYIFPVPIESGRTYEMLLDIGTGVFATVSPSVARSKVYIDREYVGEGTQYHRYLNYGQHTLRAENGTWEGERQIVVTRSDRRPVYDIVMTDQAAHYGEVVATVDGEAEIWLAGQRMGTGSWTGLLREGSYTATTRAIDCDDSQTTFSVRPGQRNEVRLRAPLPHTGYLRVYTRPQGAIVTDSRDQPVKLSEQVELPIGTHLFQFRRAGYVPLEREWTIRHGETLLDTVQMERINYVKPTAFYFGLAYTAVGLQAGITPMAGGIWRNHDLQMSFTFGMAKSKELYLYDASKVYTGTMQYKENTLAVKYGYQIALAGRFAITPQLGLAMHWLTCATLDADYGTKYADGAMANSLTVGAQLTWVPVQHLYAFVTPQMGVAVKQDDGFKAVADAAAFNASGFGISMGLMANF